MIPLSHIGALFPQKLTNYGKNGMFKEVSFTYQLTQKQKEQIMGNPRSSIFSSAEERIIYKMFDKCGIILRIHNGCAKFLASYLPESECNDLRNPAEILYIGSSGEKISETKKTAGEKGLKMMPWYEAISFVEKNPEILKEKELYCPINQTTGIALWFDTKNEKPAAIIMEEPKKIFPKMKIPCYQ